MVILKLDNFIYECDDEEEILIPPDQILLHMFKLVVVTDGITLRNYFDVLDNYPILQLLEDWGVEYCAHYLKIKDEKVKANHDLKYLGIRKVVDLNEGELDTYYDISGYEENCLNDSHGLGIDFVDVKELLDLELIILPAKIIVDNKEIFCNNNDITLFDFIFYIMYELSFQGSPADMPINRDKVKAILKQIDKDVENGDFTKYEQLK